MKTVNLVEGITFTKDLMDQLQYLQGELLARHKENAMNLIGFLIEKLDSEESDNRKYIKSWLLFMNDMRTFLKSLESSAKERRDDDE